MVRFLINIRGNNYLLKHFIATGRTTIGKISNKHQWKKKYWSKHFIASGTATIGKISNKHQGKQLLIKTLHSIRSNNHW